MGPLPSRPRVGFWNYGRSVQRPTLLCCVSLVLLICICGCQSGSTRKETLIKSAKHVESSAAELSSRNQSLLGMYSAEIETAADNIRANSSSPVTRRQALVWKAEAIPVLQTTLLRTDPAKLSADHREHVTQYYYQHPEEFRIASLHSNRPELADLNFSIDTVEDLRRLEAMPQAEIDRLLQVSFV